MHFSVPFGPCPHRTVCLRRCLQQSSAGPRRDISFSLRSVVGTAGGDPPPPSGFISESSRPPPVLNGTQPRQKRRSGCGSLVSPACLLNRSPSRAVNGSAAGVGVDGRLDAFRGEAATQAAHLTGGEAEQLRGLGCRERAGDQAGKNLSPAKMLVAQGQCPHTREYSDIIAEKLHRPGFSLTPLLDRHIVSALDLALPLTGDLASLTFT